MNTDINRAIAVRIRAERQKRNMSQQGLARLIKRGQDRISDIETGRRARISVAELYTIAAALRCEVTALLPAE